MADTFRSDMSEFSLICVRLTLFLLYEEMVDLVEFLDIVKYLFANNRCDAVVVARVLLFHSNPFQSGQCYFEPRCQGYLGPF